MDESATTSSKELLFKRIKHIVGDQEEMKKVRSDYEKTFSSLKVKEPEKLVALMVEIMQKADTLESMHRGIHGLFGYFPTFDGNSFLDALPQMFHKRVKKIMSQILPHLQGMEIVCDYGAGKGDLAKLVADNKGRFVEAWDVISFPNEKTAYPVQIFDGYKLPVDDKAYQCTYFTNVLHHIADNEKAMGEISRVTGVRLIMVETVSEGKTKQEIAEDWSRTFMNDVLWNTLFNHIDTPVPGTYDTGEKWIKRFQRYGWKCTYYQDLGYDQESIRDRHIIAVFERQ